MITRADENLFRLFYPYDFEHKHLFAHTLCHWKL